MSPGISEASENKRAMQYDKNENDVSLKNKETNFFSTQEIEDISVNDLNCSR